MNLTFLIYDHPLWHSDCSFHWFARHLFQIGGKQVVDVLIVYTGQSILYTAYLHSERFHLKFCREKQHLPVNVILIGCPFLSSLPELSKLNNSDGNSFGLFKQNPTISFKWIKYKIILIFKLIWKILEVRFSIWLLFLLSFGIGSRALFLIKNCLKNDLNRHWINDLKVAGPSSTIIEWKYPPE